MKTDQHFLPLNVVLATLKNKFKIAEIVKVAQGTYVSLARSCENRQSCCGDNYKGFPDSRQPKPDEQEVWVVELQHL